MQDRTDEERRVHPHLRDLYDDAIARIDHAFHHHHEWAGSSINFLARRVVHEAYPDLHGNDIEVLAAAIERQHKLLADAEALIDAAHINSERAAR